VRTDNSQGDFHVRRDLDGRVRVTCPPVMLLPVETTIEIAKALLQIAGVEVIFAAPGQTVIRPPGGCVQPVKRNGQ
jgi:hypothetical protein